MELVLAIVFIILVCYIFYKLYVFLGEKIIDRCFDSPIFLRGILVLLILFFAVAGAFQFNDFMHNAYLHLSWAFPLSFLLAVFFLVILFWEIKYKTSASLTECEYIELNQPLSDQEYCDLADFLKNNPSIHLKVSSPQFEDLEFLRFFPELRSLHLDLFELKSLDGLRHLPEDMEVLSFGDMRSQSISFDILKRFKDLKIS